MTWRAPTVTRSASYGLYVNSCTDLPPFGTVELAGEQPAGAGVLMIAFFLLLVIAAIALGIVGVVVKGLLYLLFIGIVVFLGALLLAALRMRRRPARHTTR